MECLRVGVIGCGYWGPNLIRNFVENAMADVVCVADLRENRLESIKSRYPKIETTKNYQDFFEMDLSAVVIATPPATHYSIAKECLEHHLHVLVEKPITTDSRQAEELIAIADERNLTLMVGHTFEYNVAVQELKNLIKSGELGKVFYVDAARLNLGLYQSLNVIWDLAPHDISILNYILESKPISVSTHGMTCIKPKMYDVAYLNLEYPNDVVANVHLSWIDPAKVRRVTVVGSAKMVVYNDVYALEKIKIYDKRVTTPEYTDTFDEFQFNYHQGDVLIPNIRFKEPLALETQQFITSIKEGTEPQSSGRDGLEVLRVIEAALRSLENEGQRELIRRESLLQQRDGSSNSKHSQTLSPSGLN